MKVAYIGNYRDASGYSRAALDYILALDSVGVEVVPRPVKMINTVGQVPTRILELEENSLSNVDVVIQHNLPSEFSYQSGVKNVGMFAYETSDFKNTGWQNKLRLMDDIIVFCEQQRFAVEDTFGDDFRQIANRVHIVPHAIDTRKFGQEYETIDFNLDKDCLKFYAIGEFNKRKNYAAMLLSYYSTFSAEDNVCLIIKTSGHEAELTQLAENIKNACKRFASEHRYPRVILITDRMSEYELMSLHYSCDVYVCASYGEAWNLPCTDALGMGNYCIVNSCGAFLDYMTPGAGYIVNSHMTPVFSDGGLPDLYTADEYWQSVDLVDLQDIFRLCNNKNYRRQYIDSPSRQDVRRQMVEQFSYGKVGELLKDALCKVDTPVY